jgi:hypothetical protein
LRTTFAALREVHAGSVKFSRISVRGQKYFVPLLGVSTKNAVGIGSAKWISETH